MNRIIIWVVLFVQAFNMNGQTTPRMRPNDKLRIKEAIKIADLFGEKIWKGINEIPFAVILVTDSVEFLIHHPYPSGDFLLSERDVILNTDVFYRKRQYAKDLLATFPAVNGVNCIVAGTPENTGRSSTDWIITLLHEHFHQYEYSQPGYYSDVEKLELSGGDKTGMWMLDYPFPYSNKKLVAQYKKYAGALFTTLADTGEKKRNRSFNTYKAERKKLAKLLTPADYRYMSFQLWQEGIARYTEYKFLELLSDFQPTKEVSKLPDFISFNDYKMQFYRSQADQLLQLKLNEDKRICFYSIGFAEGILLDKLNPSWHSLFLKDKFFIEHYSKKYK